MAATWTYKIDVTNLPDKIANVTATRNGLQTYSLLNVSFQPIAGKTLAQIRDQIATQMMALHADFIANQTLATTITTQEALLATATNAKEI